MSRKDKRGHKMNEINADSLINEDVPDSPKSKDIGAIDNVAYDVLRDTWAKVINGTYERSAKMASLKIKMKSESDKEDMPEPSFPITQDCASNMGREFNSLANSWHFMSLREAFELTESIFQVRRYMEEKAKALGYAPVVHAHWKVIDKSGNVICSKCCSLALGGRSWFCPNCGAVMDEEVNNATDRC